MTTTNWRCTGCGREYKWLNEAKTHIQVCGVSWKTGARPQIIAMESIKIKSIKYRCSYCLSIFNSFTRAQEHLDDRLDHPNASSIEEFDEDVVVDSQFKDDLDAEFDPYSGGKLEEQIYLDPEEIIEPIRNRQRFINGKQEAEQESAPEPEELEEPEAPTEVEQRFSNLDFDTPTPKKKKARR